MKKKRKKREQKIEKKKMITDVNGGVCGRGREIKIEWSTQGERLGSMQCGKRGDDKKIRKGEKEICSKQRSNANVWST